MKKIGDFALGTRGTYLQLWKLPLAETGAAKLACGGDAISRERG